MGGGSSGRGGVVPFRAGDWKCGNEGCNYHNFAKNTSCLRCGASRHQAAVVAEGGMQNYGGGNNYGGPPNMNMGSMGNSSYGGMTPASSGYGGNAGMGGPPGDFGGQSFGPPQSNYAVPSGIAAPSPYMQGGGYSQMGSNGMPGQGGFDSRAEQAFNQGNASASGGAPAGGYSNGGYGGNQGYGGDASGDPFSFLNTGMRDLGLGDREGRNGQGTTKSPQ
ncbi:MAG: hypothetical protein INR62_06275 [Rhodospirillales bacterium]|nr:hypothetical protein [Acetobacter sp.]